MTHDNNSKSVDLSPMDAVMTNYGVTILYIYASTEKHCYNLELLKASFFETLDEDYKILRGELRKDQARHGTLCIKQNNDKNSSRVSFVTDSSSTYTTEQALESLSYDLVPPARNGNNQLITVKCSLLADGGVAIGVDIAHCMLDAEAAFTFVKVWARRYRWPFVTEQPIKVNHDRCLLAARGTGDTVPHPEFRVLSPNTSTEVHRDPSCRSTAQSTLHFSLETLSRLREAISGSSEVYVSTIDALTALLVVLVTQARGHGKACRVTTCVNARPHLQPPLPKNYAGNAIFNALSTYEPDELIFDHADKLAHTLRVVARRIRDSITRTRDNAFLHFFFGPDILFTSWVRTGAYEADFGGGRACYAGMPRLPVADGMVVIADPVDSDEDGLNVVVFLESATMKRFSEHIPTLKL